MPKMFLLPENPAHANKEHHVHSAKIETAYQLARIADALEKANEEKMIEVKEDTENQIVECGACGVKFHELSVHTCRK